MTTIIKRNVSTSNVEIINNTESFELYHSNLSTFAIDPCCQLSSSTSYHGLAMSATAKNNTTGNGGVSTFWSVLQFHLRHIIASKCSQNKCME